MSGLTDADAELTFKYLSDTLQSDIEYEAFDRELIRRDET